MKLLQRQGGLTSYFGTSDSRVVEKMAEEGDHDAHLVYEAMALGVARGLARLAVLVKGKVDYLFSPAASLIPSPSVRWSRITPASSASLW